MIINEYNGTIIIYKIIKDCLEQSKEQIKRACYGNINSVNCKKSCFYYKNRHSSCIGVIESEKCKYCFLQAIHLNYLCNYIKKYYWK